MTTRRKADSHDVSSLPPPATTLEGREDQLIYAAMNLVEQRIAQGSASAQETVHFLRLGSVKNQLEQEKLRQENAVLQARIREIDSRKDTTGLYAKALAAFRGYAGQDELFEDLGDEGDADL